MFASLHKSVYLFMSPLLLCFQSISLSKKTMFTNDSESLMSPFPLLHVFYPHIPPTLTTDHVPAPKCADRPALVPVPSVFPIHFPKQKGHVY